MMRHTTSRRNTLLGKHTCIIILAPPRPSKPDFAIDFHRRCAHRPTRCEAIRTTKQPATHTNNSAASDPRASYEGELCKVLVSKDHRAGLNVACHHCCRDPIVARCPQGLLVGAVHPNPRAYHVGLR